MTRRTIDGVERSTVTIELNHGYLGEETQVVLTGFHRVEVKPNGELVVEEIRGLNDEERKVVAAHSVRQRDSRRYIENSLPGYATSTWQCFAAGVWATVRIEEIGEKE